MRLIQLRDQPRRSGNDPQSDGDLRTTSLDRKAQSAYRASVRTNPALSMMNRPTKASTLRAGEIACLHALRSGKDTPTAIAVAAHLPLGDTNKALSALSQKGLIGRGPNRRSWKVTKRGQTWAQPKSGQSGEEGPLKEVGPAGERFFALLAHPMRGAEIARRLDVGRERVRQLVVQLSAIGRIRVGDPRRPTFIVARHDDPSLLLSYKGERILSSLAQTEETIPSYVAVDLRMPIADVLNHLSWLADQDLVRKIEQHGGGVQYVLTEAGANHPQYQHDATKARPAPLPVKSARVREVLSYLADHGPSRIVDLRETLHIQSTSINALAQYLKRKGLIRKTDESLHAPVELTREGLDTQRAMVRRRR